VESVELDPRAVAHAEELGPTGPRRLAGDVAHRLVRLSAPDLIVTNPPRAGMDEAVTDGLRSSGAQKIAYVSCDPATLARDLRRLSTSYRVASLKAFDQFPQTAHVESVAILERQ
jgi:23S rRNA (uracil1939-C5)-methyltransferase